MAVDIVGIMLSSRQRIIASAKRLFWQHGYSTTSPRQVMDDSGVGPGSFYHHFPTKTDLGREVVDANGRDLLAAVKEAMEGLSTGHDRLAAFLGSVSDALQGCRIGNFAYDSGVVVEPELHTQLTSSFIKLHDLLEETARDGQNDGSLPPDLDPRAIAATMLALVEGAYVAARATGRQSYADDAISGALALLRGDWQPR